MYTFIDRSTVIPHHRSISTIEDRRVSFLSASRKIKRAIVPRTHDGRIIDDTHRPSVHFSSHFCWSHAPGPLAPWPASDHVEGGRNR